MVVDFKKKGGGGSNKIHVINPLLGMAMCQSGVVHSSGKKEK